MFLHPVFEKSQEYMVERCGKVIRWKPGFRLLLEAKTKHEFLLPHRYQRSIIALAIRRWFIKVHPVFEEQRIFTFLMQT
jgi:hypothetical protein